jgi:hypothetical protein
MSGPLRRTPAGQNHRVSGQPSILGSPYSLSPSFPENLL